MDIRSVIATTLEKFHYNFQLDVDEYKYPPGVLLPDVFPLADLTPTVESLFRSSVSVFNTRPVSSIENTNLTVSLSGVMQN